MTEEALAKDIVSKLGPKFEIERIILFGSRSKENCPPESDWDVLVIASSSEPFLQRQGMALAALGPRRYALDLLVFTPEEAKEAESMLGSAVFWALREGRTIYAKGVDSAVA